MKHIVITIVFVLGVVANLWAAEQKTENRLKSIEENVAVLQESQQSMDAQVSLLNEKSDALTEMVNSSNGFIANQISASELRIDIFAIIVGVIAVFLGVYIGRMHARIQTISETVKSASKDVDEKLQQVSSLSKELNENFDSFFERIRRADTEAYVKRLVDVPLDVMNLSDLLLTRELKEEDYDYLKRAYLKVKEMNKLDEQPNYPVGPSYGAEYRVILFQHFAGRAILDDDLRESIVSHLNHLVGCCFENDIKKSLSDLAPVLSKRNVPFDRVDVLKKLLSAIDKSEYKGNPEVLGILRNGIADEELWASATAKKEKGK